MDKTYRIKLRNCIRENTYRYYLKEKLAKKIWQRLENCFGPSFRWGDLNIYCIENERFVLRKSLDENAFTLIRKKCFSEKDEDIIHNLIEFDK